jgi:hypothetical protein
MFNYAIFWWKRHIVEGVEPEMTGSSADTEWLKGQRSGYTEPRVTNTDAELDEVCKALGDDVQELARVTERVEKAKNLIKKFMADDNATVLESSVGNFTWKTDSRGIAKFVMPFRSDRA